MRPVVVQKHNHLFLEIILGSLSDIRGELRVAEVAKRQIDKSKPALKIASGCVQAVVGEINNYASVWETQRLFDYDSF